VRDSLLFITCYDDTLFPEIGLSVVALLERPGAELDFHPCQTCCGQRNAGSGFRAKAFSQVMRLVRLYQHAARVVIPPSSCVAVIGDRYPWRLRKQGTREQGDKGTRDQRPANRDLGIRE
jgi:L-lactate dehydrogenase complex protein LldE